MRIDGFRRLAARMWDGVPSAFRQGVDGVVVEPNAPGHPYIPGVFTLGECLTDEWPGGAGGEGDTRSRIILYHGSFRALEEMDPQFDWHEELWETLLHELLHHREAAAREDGLEVYDWAADQNFARHAGMAFDPAFYRVLPADPDGAVRVDAEMFVEALLEPEERSARFRWRGSEYDVRVPPGEAPLYVNPRNLALDRLWVVVWRRRPSGLRRALAWLTGRSPRSQAPGASGVPHLVRRSLPVPAT